MRSLRTRIHIHVVLYIAASFVHIRIGSNPVVVDLVVMMVSGEYRSS